jgi:hypothetical protein
MKIKDQKKGLIALFVILLVLIVGVMVAPEITLAIDAPLWQTNSIQLFVDVREFITTNRELLVMFLGVLVVAFYFLVYKPKLVANRNRR